MTQGDGPIDRNRPPPVVINDPVDRNRPPGTGSDDRNRDRNDGGARGPGQGRMHSQGPAHANARAIAAVCRNPNAAAHSVLGSRCDVVAYRDPNSGGNVYTQPGMELPTSVEPSNTRGTTTGREGRRVDEPLGRKVRP
ncbi:MAG: hypothetical protein ACREO3_05080 [Arenimonas sp.]